MEDLSHMTNLKTGLNAGESMSAGNTVSNLVHKTAMAAPGSLPVDGNPSIGSKEDDPSLDVGPLREQASTLTNPGSAISADGNWKKAGK